MLMLGCKSARANDMNSRFLGRRWEIKGWEVAARTRERLSAETCEVFKIHMIYNI